MNKAKKKIVACIAFINLLFHELNEEAFKTVFPGFLEKHYPMDSLPNPSPLPPANTEKNVELAVEQMQRLMVDRQWYTISVSNLSHLASADTTPSTWGSHYIYSILPLELRILICLCW